MVGTLEEAKENLARQASRKEAHELSPYEKDLAGVSRARAIRLPMDSVVNLRRVAGLLRELANKFDDLSRQERSTVSIVLEAHQAVTICQINLTASTGKRHYKQGAVQGGDN